ncbi:ATP-binding cassette transporter [Thecamonas trahens ATCC 50062]|uniref:ATP-binding cassette transporter n=1 Tax=Thecamonas trahens ATCC 50062 TaxID=461836 RepID=A0A0L0DUW7_THETB|nr:ATP-binding cassette transporter [Thecamonas trahens ATCC 50062]KNC56025.1 ATP-binding cassette transporter [Thecamonas trahens ATCC 50062]|eukprot:XP_013761069.1 ATP-binding cassette transporter [Thecamonas trahens ATCC 50062]
MTAALWACGSSSAPAPAPASPPLSKGEKRRERKKRKAERTKQKRTREREARKTETADASAAAVARADAIAAAASNAPVAKASIISLMTYGWASALMRAGARAALEFDDLWATAPEDLGATGVEAYRATRAEFPDETVRSTFVRTFVPQLRILIGLVLLWVTAMMSYTVFVFRELMDFLASDDPVYLGIVLAVLMLILTFVRSVAVHLIFFTSIRVGVRAKSALSLIVFEKVLRAGAGTSSVGSVVNLVSADAHSILMAFGFAVWLVAGPVLLTLALIFLIVEVGPAALPGFALMLAIMPLQMFAAKKIGELRHAALAVTDNRTRLMSEILASIKVIKLYAWESSFADKIAAVRDAEMTQLRKSALVKKFNLMLSFSFPVLVAFVVFAIYTSTGNRLTASKVFVVLSIVNICRFPLIVLPMAIKFTTEAWVGFNRLAAFLDSPDLPVRSSTPSSTPSITIDNASFTWPAAGSDEPDPGAKARVTLKNIAFEAAGVDKVAIVGPVGSGKSSLLAAILADIPLASGAAHESAVRVEGTTALVTQQPWVPNASLRDNITFGLPFDEDKYQSVIDATALQPDIDLLPAGDGTEIGERGINLSGGQKQRVALARALYAERNIYLLDDPLSAVDAHVGKHIFNEFVMGALSDALVVMVTNQVQYLKDFDYIYVLANGSVIESGSYDELMAAQGTLAELMESFLVSEAPAPALDSLDDSPTPLHHLSLPTPAAVSASRTVDSLQFSHTDLGSVHEFGTSEVVDPADGRLIEAEERAEGSVGWKVYKTYGEAAGSPWVIAYVLGLFSAVQTARISSDWWLSYWISQDNGRVDKLDWHLGWYGFFVLLLIVF